MVKMDSSAQVTASGWLRACWLRPVTCCYAPAHLQGQPLLTNSAVRMRKFCLPGVRLQAKFAFSRLRTALEHDMCFPLGEARADTHLKADAAHFTDA